jgi:hypothetical protein
MEGVEKGNGRYQGRGRGERREEGEGERERRRTEKAKILRINPSKRAARGFFQIISDSKIQ